VLAIVSLQTNPRRLKGLAIILFSSLTPLFLLFGKQRSLETFLLALGLKTLRSACHSLLRTSMTYVGAV
jgi:hypothetical protein